MVMEPGPVTAPFYGRGTGHKHRKKKKYRFGMMLLCIYFKNLKIIYNQYTEHPTQEQIQTMKYRPDFALRQLRTEQVSHTPPAVVAYLVHRRYTWRQQYALQEERRWRVLSVQQRGVFSAVQRVVW